MLSFHHDWPHSVLMISCWVPSPLTVLMAVSFFMAFGQTPFHSGCSGPVGAQIPAQMKGSASYMCASQKGIGC